MVGFFIEPEDYENFANDILQLFNDENKYKQMKQKALDQSKKFSLEKNTLMLIRLFERLAKK